jgi:ribosome biogenesis protein Nip4
MNYPRTYEDFCELFVAHAPLVSAVGDRVYLESDALKAFKSGEQRKPYSRGLPLGMDGKEFVPTPALLSLLAQESNVKAVITDKHAAHLFLCGRDVFHGGFTCTRGEGLVLVQNARDENLGLAELTQGRDGLMLRNILDRGNYLRHERITLSAKAARRKVGAPRKHKRRS